MNIKYLLGSILSLPLLPLLYFQGQRIRANVPELPEAIEPQGIAGELGKTKLNLLCLGESTIAGVGVKYHGEGFAGTLAAELANSQDAEIHWRVYAKSGYTAKQVKQKLVPELREEKPDLIVIGLGGNDAFTLNRPWKWRQQMEQLIDALQEQFKDIPIFLTNVPPIKEFPAFTKPIKFVIGNLVEILGQELTKITKQKHLVHYNAEIITIKSWTKKWKVDGNVNDFFSDGVHPSKLTYQVWAKDMAQFIDKKLADSRVFRKQL
ncbi:MAG: SGNH/GDSL hydrolase family protein [Bacteroidota bacterium]